MKKYLAFLLCLSALMAVIACNGGLGQPAFAENGTQALALSLYKESDFDEDGAVQLYLDYEVYDKSMTNISYYIANHSGAEVSFGEGYVVEVWHSGAWCRVPEKENVGWNAQSYTLPDGGTYSAVFSLSIYDYTFDDGLYRLIKTVGGHRLYVTFKIGAEGVSADAPFGYMDLEDLPADYTLAQAAADGVVLLCAQGNENEEALRTFSDKVRMGAPAMVRVLRTTVEGDSVLTDIRYDGECFLWREDTTRDAFSAAPGISEEKYGFFVTDGEAFYLSDCVGADAAGGRTIDARQKRLFSAGELADAEALLASVRQLTKDTQRGNAALARFWSPDGKKEVSLTAEALEFSVSVRHNGYWGMTQTLPLPTDGDYAGYAVTAVEWLGGDRFILTAARTEKDDRLFAVYTIDESAEKLADKLHLCKTQCATGYMLEDGEPQFYFACTD